MGPKEGKAGWVHGKNNHRRSYSLIKAKVSKDQICELWLWLYPPMTNVPLRMTSRLKIKYRPNTMLLRVKKTETFQQTFFRTFVKTMYD